MKLYIPTLLISDQFLQNKFIIQINYVCNSWMKYCEIYIWEIYFYSHICLNTYPWKWIFHMAATIPQNKKNKEEEQQRKTLIPFPKFFSLMWGRCSYESILGCIHSRQVFQPQIFFHKFFLPLHFAATFLPPVNIHLYYFSPHIFFIPFQHMSEPACIFDAKFIAFNPRPTCSIRRRSGFRVTPHIHRDIIISALPSWWH